MGAQNSASADQLPDTCLWGGGHTGKRLSIPSRKCGTAESLARQAWVGNTKTQTPCYPQAAVAVPQSRKLCLFFVPPPLGKRNSSNHVSLV